jgi:hypothetical protein
VYQRPVNHLGKLVTPKGGGSAPKTYGSSGTGWDMPAGATIVGYTRASGLSQSPMLPRWVAPAPVAAPAAPAQTKITVSSPVNVATPITTQITTAVSPSMNVAAGSQGVQQGATTGQQATPTASNQTPQGSSAGISPEQVQAMLEQKQREQDALNAQRVAIAEREAEYRATVAADQAAKVLEAEYNARIKALESAQQPPTITTTQQAPVSAPQPAPAPAAPAPAPAPVTTGTTGTDAISQTASTNPATASSEKNPPWLLWALAGGAFLVVMSGDGKKQTHKRRVKR